MYQDFISHSYKAWEKFLLHTHFSTSYMALNVCLLVNQCLHMNIIRAKGTCLIFKSISMPSQICYESSYNYAGNDTRCICSSCCIWSYGWKICSSYYMTYRSKHLHTNVYFVVCIALKMLHFKEVCKMCPHTHIIFWCKLSFWHWCSTGGYLGIKDTLKSRGRRIMHM